MSNLPEFQYACFDKMEQRYVAGYNHDGYFYDSPKGPKMYISRYDRWNRNKYRDEEHRKQVNAERFEVHKFKFERIE